MLRTLASSPIAPQDSGASVLNQDSAEIHRQILSAVSHDLKTPLASIIGALEVLHRTKGKLSEEKQSILNNLALQEAYRLDSFITNILDMTKLENHMVAANLETVELNSLIRDCLAQKAHRLQGASINFLGSVPCEILIDPVLLNRVFDLVLDNAVKYGGKPPVVSIECGRESDLFGFIRIRDNGPGIPEKHLDAIFSKYTRFVKEDQNRAGTGLGLTICRAIMKLLGGTITAANSASGGALFTVQFPLR